MSEVFSNFIGCLILIIADILFVKIIIKSNIKIKMKYLVLFLLIVSILHTIIVSFIIGSLRTILTFLLYIITHKILYKLSWVKSLFLTIIYALLMLIPDIFLIVISTKILNISKVYYYEVFAGSILANFLICLLVIIISLFFRKLIDKILELKSENNIIVIILSGVTLLCVGFIFFQFIDIYIFSNNVIIYIMIITFFIIILFNLIKERVNNDNLKERYDKLLEYMVPFEKGIEKQRILRHENKNNLIAIKSKIIDKDNEKEIIKYIDELLKISSTKVKNEKYAKFGYLPSNGIKGLFYYKTDEAEQKGIKVSINISKDIKKSVISNMDTRNFRLLGNIIGVFLDNAIEASLNSEGKKMGIEIYKNKKNVEILISNSYSNKIDTKKIGFITYSTKGKNRGHGLLLVNSIIKSNKIFENEKIITNELFTQKLIVKKLD